MILDDKLKQCVKTGTALSTKMKLKVTNRRIRPIVPLSVKKKYKALDSETKKLICDPPLIDEAS